MERKRDHTTLVVCPLQSIIDDQIAMARNIGLSATSAADLSEETNVGGALLVCGAIELSSSLVTLTYTSLLTLRNLGFTVLIVSMIKANPSHVFLTFPAHGLQSS